MSNPLEPFIRREVLQERGDQHHAPVPRKRLTLRSPVLLRRGNGCYPSHPMSPTVAIISATIAVVSLVFAIFGASWLNLRQVERLLDQLEKRFDERFNSLEKWFDERFNSLEKRFDERFNSLEKRFDERFNSLEKRFEQRFVAVEQRLALVEQRLDRIERQLEVLFKPAPPRA